MFSLFQINGRASSELRAPIAAAETIVETPIKMQAAPAPAPASPAPSPASAAPTAPASSPAPSQPQKPTKRTAKDYIFGKLIGEGCYSTVFLAKDIHSGKEYASTYYQIILFPETTYNYSFNCDFRKIHKLICSIFFSQLKCVKNFTSSGRRKESTLNAKKML